MPTGVDLPGQNNSNNTNNSNLGFLQNSFGGGGGPTTSTSPAATGPYPMSNIQQPGHHGTYVIVFVCSYSDLIVIFLSYSCSRLLSL